MICSFDRVLKRHDYGFEICGKRKDAEFARTREVLRSKQIQLKKQGKRNNCHIADALSDEDIDALFRTEELGFQIQLLFCILYGSSTPYSLVFEELQSTTRCVLGMLSYAMIIKQMSIF
jgi:hypothetical protein